MDFIVQVAFAFASLIFPSFNKSRLSLRIRTVAITGARLGDSGIAAVGTIFISSTLRNSKAVALPFAGFSQKESLAMTRNPPSVITAAVFDTKPYDQEALQRASANSGIEWHFLEFRLTEDTAYAAKNAQAVLRICQ